MMLTIELFGALRLKAGGAHWRVEARDLSEALERLIEQAPGLRVALIECDDGGWALHPAYRACVNSRSFVTDPRSPLSDGDVVLLMAADAGG